MMYLELIFIYGVNGQTLSSASGYPVVKDSFTEKIILSLTKLSWYSYK